MMQLTFDMETLPPELVMLERRAQQEIATPRMKTAGQETMKIFTTTRMKLERKMQ